MSESAWRKLREVWAKDAFIKELDKRSGLTVTPADRALAGGCCFCNDRRPGTSDTVYVVKSEETTISVRFCAACVARLTGQVGRFLAEGSRK